MNPVMRYLGENALAQGFSQESLAKRYREHTRVSSKFNGANVRSHFMAKKPQRETVKRYAEILGLSEERLHIVEHGKLDAIRLRQWEQKLFRTLSVFQVDFKDGVAEAVRDALLEPVLRNTVLTKVAMAWGAEKAGWSDVPVPLQVFADAIFPNVDLHRFVQRRTKGEATLFMIYAESMQNLYGNDAKARAFVDACAAILRLDGFDTRPMYDFLNKSLAHNPGRGTSK